MTVASAKIFSFEQLQAAKAARKPKSPRRLMSIEVMSPDQPGGRHHGKFVDAYVDPTLDAPANLERYADALEEVAARLRTAAQRDAC